MTLEDDVPDPDVQRQLESLHSETQEHAMMMAEHRLRIERVESQVSMAATKEQMTALSETVSLKLDHLHDQLAPIRTSLYWTVCLVMSAVLLALLSIVVYGPSPVGR